MPTIRTKLHPEIMTDAPLSKTFVGSGGFFQLARLLFTQCLLRGDPPRGRFGGQCLTNLGRADFFTVVPFLKFLDLFLYMRSWNVYLGSSISTYSWGVHISL